ncbi:helix-turn-helix domain-containing protein [Candidatus Hecatella orcuttiae]|uniref:helix-turn-helix domain-containing protein n=1 Tax=Candidatus Hecatella orcuttiae TaxID=1935119 RepID=UPI00286803A8|nr:helix-turn-helix domain-containing protein [Candidatus Hecatella orcuttiae]
MQYYTTSQLADILKVRTERVTELVSKGVIKGSKNSTGHWVIPETELPKLKQYIESRARMAGKMKEKESTFKLPVGKPCPEAEEIEPDLYQCPKTDWLRVRSQAPICIPCQPKPQTQKT